MKFLKLLVNIFLVCIAIFFIAGLLLPKTGTYENSYRIAAPVDEIKSEILDLYDNHLWPIWNSQDTSMKIIDLPNDYSYSWKGDLVGEGICEVTVTNSSIEDTISFQGKTIGATKWLLTAGDTATIDITFNVFAQKNIGARWTNLFLNRLIGKDINTIVTNMKQNLENEE